MQMKRGLTLLFAVAVVGLLLVNARPCEAG